ncbi:bifunctional 2-polyprenyl-6-hydroxyphenol methylase/3-demethylubiquinol 3-O-methyltransferase UbiG [Microbacterium sp. p3-SID336]|uniref:class I SAM-dependent methyltransferase n=1 Tax=Microbacterium sp. p3-SID336 TaxID=2916212 RepID=UPI0021A89360|nr:class I SAM-dependent methyltransferase [Microbacterium sp. p3-SID336]MCT1476530.1 class I SAM-dependent methyltransferase [Microbacterium sp. p3-SID336]
MNQNEIDEAIQAYYSGEFDENARLTTRSAQGRLEFERTQEVIRRATPPPARVLDVGGATGVHAAALVATGYDVVLVDPVPSQVATAALVGTFKAVVGDARALDFPDDSFDAVLIAGPLYHLAGRDDRRRALREARRVCRPGGVVHASAIPRLAVFAAAALEPALLDADLDGWLDLLRVGTPVGSTRFPGGHFHTARELEEEMLASGIRDVTVIGLEGPGGFALESVTEVNEADYAAAIQLARTFAGAGHIRDFSNHLLGSGLA